MNWLVIFKNPKREGSLPAAALIASDGAMTVAEAIQTAVRRLEARTPLEGYASVEAFQVIA